MILDFSWDPVKAERNKTNHRVTFHEASTIFYDPFFCEGVDHHHSNAEEVRYYMIGLSNKNRVLYVIYTERKRGTEIRIISARLAQPSERKEYEEELC